MWNNASLSVYAKALILSAGLIFQSDLNAACELFTSSTNPSSTLPSSWADVTSGGAYATPAIDGVWVDVHVQNFTDDTASCATVEDPYPRRYCAITGGGDDPDTPDIIEPHEWIAVFSYTYIIECPTGYSYNRNNDICYLLDPDSCIDPFCPDGSPVILDGYPETCDRPPLKQCEDGSWVDAATGICNLAEELCTDYQTCLDWAVANSSCGEESEIQFDYTDPLNFTYTCTEQLPDSPDLAENGGNEDGNPYNDPGITPPTDGSTPTVAETDPNELASAIDNALRDDFSNVERAARETGLDVVDAIGQQTQDLTANADSNNDSLESKLDQMIDAQNQTTAAIEDQSFQMSMDGDTGSLSGPCDPSMPDYMDCLALNGQALRDHPEAPTYSESMQELYSRLQSSPLVSSLSGIVDRVQLAPGSCEELGFKFPLNGEYISTDIHCQIGESIRSTLSLVMIVFWTIIGYRIFVSA